MPRFFPVDHPDDPRLADFRQVRERDLVGRQGRFVAEGEIVLASLVRSPFHIALSVLIDAKRREKLDPLLSRLPGEVPVYLAPQDVLDAIAGFHLHRGILAIGERSAGMNAEALLSSAPRQANVVVAIGIANHDNMGGLFRNAAAFGTHAILVDAESCDPMYRKAIRVSAGAVLQVPWARTERGTLLPLLRNHGFEPLALSPSGGLDLRDVQPPSRAAVLLGAEGPGLPSALISACTAVRIPMSAGFDSLNVATASGIVLHHLAACRR